VVIFLRGRARQVSKEPQAEGLYPIEDWQAPGDIPDCLVGSVPGVWNSQNFPYVAFNYKLTLARR